MTSLRVNPGKLPPVVYVPSSKSYANRALVLAAFSEESLELRSLPNSDDVVNLLRAFEELGIRIDRKGEGVVIEGGFPGQEGAGVEIAVGEGGTTARFLAAMLLRGSAPYVLILGKRLKYRPWDEFIKFVRANGGRANLIGERLELQGPLRLSALVSMDCSRTTQFASGIQLAFGRDGVRVVPEGLQTSMSYWEMTEKLIESVQSMRTYSIPLDWSSAAYPLAFGALNQPIELPGLHYDRYQADSKFLKLLQEFSAITEDEKGIKVSPVTSFHRVNMDVCDCLDLVPALSFFLAHVPGVHSLDGVGNLVHKESDRLTEVRSLLSRFDRKTELEGDRLLIHGSTARTQAPIDLLFPEDHRMVMVGGLFLRHHGGGSVAPAEAVRKSYPGFFELFN